MPDLFDPARFGDLALANRIVLAPMTRSRNVEQLVRLLPFGAEERDAPLPGLLRTTRLACLRRIQFMFIEFVAAGDLEEFAIPDAYE